MKSRFKTGSTGALASLDRRQFVAGTVGLGLSAGLLGTSATMVSADETPKKGGNLRVAILGGGSADTLDANSNATQPDTARIFALYEPLRDIGKGGAYFNVLAESMEANKDATEWTIKLRPGVTFHNGKPLTAEDVKFTLLRITNPAAPLVGAPGLGPVNRDAITVVDDLTLRVGMTAPFAMFDAAVADKINVGIVPVGYDPKNPIGTGPFKFESFTPGQQSVFTRYDGYWGQPAYLDKLTIIDSFASATTAFNALQGGEIDAFAAAPLALARQVQDGGPIKRLLSEASQWTPFTMRVDVAPFDNPDVRMAMRLVVDRQQIVDIAYNGYATIANDVFALWDGAQDVFVRNRDIEKAKALLKKAGHENLTVDLMTADIADGVVTSAQIYARQAADAGITVNVKQVTPEVFFGEQYLKWPFAQSFWTRKEYLPQVALCLLPDSPYNETHWNDAAYVELYKKALATVDADERLKISRQLQKTDFEQGGYIIPSNNQIIDLVAQNVQGLHPGVLLALGDYDYSKIWLA